MSDKPFVINDRRRFTATGEVRPDAPPVEPKENQLATTPEPPQPEPATKDSGPRLVATDSAAPSPDSRPQEEPSADTSSDEAAQLPQLTEEQTSQASRAYDATVDRIDTAMRAQNLGAEPTPPMTFERMVQSIYMQAILQLGGATEPGQQMSVDLLGARHTIDMLAIIEEKTRGNLTEAESKLVASALFEMRMAFLEITQALARQAATRATPEAVPPTGGPSIVR